MRPAIVTVTAAALCAIFLTATAAEEAPLIPREHFFGNPDRAAGQISPEGDHISFLAPRDGVLNVWVAPAPDLGSAQVITNDTSRGIRDYFWAPDGWAALGRPSVTALEKSPRKTRYRRREPVYCAAGTRYPARLVHGAS